MQTLDFVLMPVRIRHVSAVVGYLRTLDTSPYPVDPTMIEEFTVEQTQSKRLAWSEEDLRYFDRGDNLSRRRYRAVLDDLSERPGRANAVSRDDQATMLGIAPESLDNMYGNISYWMNHEFEGREPPAHLSLGYEIDPAWPPLSYRWMSEEDTAAWRRLRGLD